MHLFSSRNVKIKAQLLSSGDLGEVTDLVVQKPQTSLAVFAGISN
jgi:hypothetical protein